MNRVFRDVFGSVVVIFIDDILIYIKTREEHEKHLILLLSSLQKDNLYAVQEL